MSPSAPALLDRIAAYRRHTREALDLPSVNHWGIRRHACTLVDYLGANPDLLDPCRYPGRLEQVVDYAFRAEDDDIRHHATEAAGAWLRDHSETPLLADMVVRVTAAYAVASDLRNPAMLLAYASERRGSWIRGRLEGSPLSDMRLAVVAMHRRGCVREVDLQAGEMGTGGERIRFLERVGKVSFGAAFREPELVSRAMALLDGPLQELLLGGDSWQDRALAADLVAASEQYDAELIAQLLDGMQDDPEPEVRVRKKVAYIALTTGADVSVDRTRDAAARLVDLVETVGEGEDGRLRYANGALVPLMHRLRHARRGASSSFEALHARLVEIAAEHPVPYNRKTAVKLCAKLLKGRPARTSDWVQCGIRTVLGALEDSDPVVREEAFLSVIKRGWTTLLTDSEISGVAARLPSIDDEDDPGILQTLACFLPRLADQAPLPTSGEDLAETLEEVAIRGNEDLSRLVSALRCELPDWRTWSARHGLPALLEMGGAAGPEALHLYRDALPALSRALGDDLGSCWPGLRDIALSTGRRSPDVLGTLIPLLRADLGELFFSFWGGVVRLAGGFDWTRKTRDWFRVGILGARDLVATSDAGPGLWPRLLDLGLRSDKHWVKTFDNLRHLRDLAYPGETETLVETVEGLIRDLENPYPALKRLNLLIWVLREAVGGADAFEGVRRELEKLETLDSAVDPVEEIGRIPMSLSGGRGPQFIYLD